MQHLIYKLTFRTITNDSHQNKHMFLSFAFFTFKRYYTVTLIQSRNIQISHFVDFSSTLLKIFSQNTQMAGSINVL